MGGKMRGPGSAEPEAVRRAVLEAYDRGEGSVAQIALRFGCSKSTVHSWCSAEASRGRYLPRARRPRVDRPVRLPIVRGYLVPTPGPKLECGRYEDCLSAFVATHPRSDPQASCPPGCRWHVPPPAVRATDFLLQRSD